MRIQSFRVKPEFPVLNKEPTNESFPSNNLWPTDSKQHLDKGQLCLILFFRLVIGTEFLYVFEKDVARFPFDCCFGFGPA